MRFRFRWEVWSSCCTSGLILPFSEQFLKLSESQLIVCQLLHQDQHLCSPHTHNHVAHPAGSTWMSAFLENSLFHLLGPDASPGPQVLPTALKLWCVVFFVVVVAVGVPVFNCLGIHLSGVAGSHRNFVKLFGEPLHCFPQQLCHFKFVQANTGF